MITLASRKMAMQHQISNFVKNGNMLMPRSGGPDKHPRTAQIVSYLTAISRGEFQADLREFIFDDLQARTLVRLIMDQSMSEYEQQYNNMISQDVPATSREQRLSQVGGLTASSVKDIFQDIKINYDTFKLLQIANAGSFIYRNDGGIAEMEAGQ
jgi:hypothetical protein